MNVPQTTPLICLATIATVDKVEQTRSDDPFPNKHVGNSHRCVAVKWMLKLRTIVNPEYKSVSTSVGQKGVA